ncbi:MFS transporter [Sulfurospirillum arcachonense]|uniref:MFS transporter n=1 Tax=Sulfurospirillum arcachonense TaxID=57666 RepID=UPI00046ADDD6|nr:MFS transporter [Sulfurospirillum arcachonense]
MDKRITYFALLIISPLTLMTSTVLMASLPNISEYFAGMKNIHLLSQLIVTIPFISITLFAPFVHHLTKIWEKKQVFIYALFYCAILGAFTGILDNIYYILIARFLFGFGIATISSIFFSLIGDYFEGHQRNVFLGHQRSFAFLAGIVFTMLGSWVGNYSWRYCFFLYLLIFIVVATSILLLKGKNNIVEEIKPQSELFKKYFPIFFFSFLLNLFFYILPTQLPFLLNQLDLNAYIGVLISCNFLLAIFSASFFGYLNKKFTLKQLLVGSLHLKAISFLMMASVSTFGYFFLASIITGISTGLIHICIAKWLLDKIPAENRLQGSSFLTSSTYCGFFLSPIFFYPIKLYDDFDLIFWISGVSLILIAFYLHAKMEHIIKA